VSRRTIPERIKQNVLLRSRRRCPVCFLEGKGEPQEGALAHIDRALQKDEADNLVFLCLPHHHQLDEGSLTPKKVKQARAKLYEAFDDGQADLAKQHTWHAYEESIVNLFRSAIANRFGDSFSLYKSSLYRSRSGVSHEVDLAVEFEVGGLRYLTLFEIKHRRAKLGAEDVLRFWAVVDDIGANKGVIVSSAGFSAAALHMARTKGLALLQIAEDADRLDDAIFEDATGLAT
jgi:hypothetical protein